LSGEGIFFPEELHGTRSLLCITNTNPTYGMNYFLPFPVNHQAVNNFPMVVANRAGVLAKAWAV